MSAAGTSPGAACALLRVWLPDRPGALGAVASRIGAVRGDIVGIDVLERNEGVAIDEFGVVLSDAELSPAAIAAQLHVSVRTLQRAFASLDESFSAYIRRRRLEEAAEALTAFGSRLSVSEAAALWHFTDSSHFIRAFKKQYHATPAQFARRLT